MEQRRKIIVAGAGPAGLTAAIFAARQGAEVIILEGMERPGKKLLLTGNGRCNITNLDKQLPEAYYGSGREIAASPTVLMVAYPVRGLDINSSYTIYNLLNQQKERGVAVIFVGEDLDVLLELCDRILVIGSGCVTGIVDARTTTKEEIGLLMTKGKGEEK